MKKRIRKETQSQYHTEPWLEIRGQIYACEDAERLGELDLYIRMQKRLARLQHGDKLISARSAQRIKCAFCTAGVRALPDGVFMRRKQQSQCAEPAVDEAIA
jgi:hypothetical protein